MCKSISNDDNLGSKRLTVFNFHNNIQVIILIKKDIVFSLPSNEIESNKVSIVNVPHSRQRHQTASHCSSATPLQLFFSYSL